MSQHKSRNFLGDQHDCQFASDPRVNKELAASLGGKHIIIAGAGRGIGRATAELFAHSHAASINLIALELSEVEETARLCKEINPNIIFNTAAFDIKDFHEVQQFVDKIEQQLGGVHVVFMNAGRPPQFLPIHESDPDVWWDTVAVSLRGSFNFSRAVLPLMRRHGSGRIIFTSSAGAHVTSDMGSYTIGKMGSSRLAEIIHHENKDRNIKAFSIHPGVINTRFISDFRDASEGKFETGSYVSNTLANEEKSTQNALNFFQNIKFDAPQMPAGMVVALSSGKLDFLSGRYVDCSRAVEKYIEQEQKIREGDLMRIKLVVDTDWCLPGWRD
jgi:NAD(P)-dependent dehydrogenase (short-subunit alcohol dehydrogenase family)